MGLWSSLVDGVKSLGSGISTGAKWVWNNASLARVSWGVLTYTTDTIAHIFEQGLALRKAIPTLINNPVARKVANGMTHVFLWDVLPVLTITYLNSISQSYLNESDDPDSRNVVLDSLVEAGTLYFGIKALGRMIVLDTVGPSAFYSNKVISPPSDCEENCNLKRKTKGLIREPEILWANDLLITGIEQYSPAIARIVDATIKGRYITRLVTPERCERHKAMDSASVMALGLSFEASKMLMDYVLARYIGMPANFMSSVTYYPIYRTMEHLLLLLHINVGAHMDLPSAKNKSSSSYDPLTIWEGLVRFVVDVQIAGLMKRIPIDFKPEKNKPPLIPLAPVLRGITHVLNSDLEKETRANAGALGQIINRLSVIVPSMYRSVDGLLNDPIIKMYWPEIRRVGIYASDIILSIGQSKTVAVVAWAPKSVASAVHLFTGAPKKATQIVLELTQEEDLHDLVRALKLWFERHDLECKVTLIEQPSNVILHGGKELLPVPDVIDAPPVATVQELLTDRSKKPTAVSVSELIPIERKQITNCRPTESESVTNVSDLFPLKRRSLVKEPSITENRDSLFTTRRRINNVMPASTSSAASLPLS